MTKKAASREIELLPGAIVRDPEFNCRKEASSLGGTLSPADPFGQSEFDASILEHGVLQPVCVRQRGEEWLLVYGFRRVEASERLAPERPIRCTVMESTGDETIDAANARVLNLVENLHRADLRPWEIAEALFQLRSTSENKASSHIASLVGLSETYVRNLIRLRTKAHPEVWAQFRRWGMTMRVPYLDVLEITTLPQERQLEAWNAIVEAQRTIDKRGRPAGSKSTRPGQAKLLTYFNAVSSLTSRSGDFKKGLKLGLAIALGKKKWTFNQIGGPEDHPKEQ